MTRLRYSHEIDRQAVVDEVLDREAFGEAREDIVKDISKRDRIHEHAVWWAVDCWEARHK